MLVAASVAVSILLGLYFSTTVDAVVEPPVESHLTPLVSVDLRSFSDRAAAWTEAHRDHRDQTRARAMSLAAQARSSQESQALLNSTTTAAPTTTAPNTTTAPATTAPTTTVAADDTKDSNSEVETKSATTTTTVAPSTTVAATAGPTEEQWEALRQCESTGNYRAISISPAGRYRGAYQFSPSTLGLGSSPDWRLTISLAWTLPRHRLPTRTEWRWHCGRSTVGLRGLLVQRDSDTYRVRE